VLVLGLVLVLEALIGLIVFRPTVITRGELGSTKRTTEHEDEPEHEDDYPNRLIASLFPQRPEIRIR